MALSRGELLRKITHMAMGLFAFAAALSRAVLGGRAGGHGAGLQPVPVSPHRRAQALARARATSRARRSASSSIRSPCWCLILVFYKRLEVAAAAWGILAFGDGMASVAGMTLGRRKLPWNPGKSWIGSARLRAFRRHRCRGAAGLDGAGLRPRLRLALRLRGLLRHRAARRGARVAAPGARRQPRRAAGLRALPARAGADAGALGGLPGAGRARAAARARGPGERGARRRGLRGAHGRPVGGGGRLPGGVRDLLLPGLARATCCSSPSSSSAAPAPSSGTRPRRRTRSRRRREGGAGRATRSPTPGWRPPARCSRP